MSVLQLTVVSDADAIWGSERSILTAAPHLAELDVAVTLACPHGEFSSAGRQLGLGHIPLQLPPRGGVRVSPLRDQLRDTATVPATVRAILRATRSAHVVHSNNLLLHPDAALAGRLGRRPTVLELHDIAPAGGGTAALAVAGALASASVSISSATSARLRGPGRRRLHLVPQAIDTERFTAGPAPDGLRHALTGGADDGRLLVGMLGRVDPAKGIHRLIQAAVAVPDIHVSIVGAPGSDDGSYLRHVLDLGARLLGDRFTYAGTTDDPVAVLRAFDVLVNASDAEPFGLSVLEAQACGVPVIGTDAGGIPDFVQHGRTGLLVGVDCELALAGALAAVRDPLLRERLGSNGAEQARRSHSAAGRAASLAAVYRRCAGTPSRRSAERLALAAVPARSAHHQDGTDRA